MRSADEAPEDWPTEIREILNRGEFVNLTQDELHKATAFIEATGGRRMISYEKQREDAITGKQERNGSARKKLSQIILYNNSKRAEATVALGVEGLTQKEPSAVANWIKTDVATEGRKKLAAWVVSGAGLLALYLTNHFFHWFKAILHLLGQ